MALFSPDNHSKSEDHSNAYAVTELVYTIVDFLAALLFVVGSILFFRETTTYIGTWMFLIGSIFFGLKPTIKLARELYYLRLDGLDKRSREQS